MKNSFAFTHLTEYGYNCVNAVSTPLTTVEHAIGILENGKFESIAYLRRKDLTPEQKEREQKILNGHYEAIEFLQKYGKIDEWDYTGNIRQNFLLMD